MVRRVARCTLRRQLLRVVAPRPLGGSERCRELLDNIPDFEGLFERKTPEEVGKMLDEWLEGGDPEESGSESEKYNTKNSDDVQKAFNDLLQQSA